MDFITQLQQQISPWHLLNHAFYQSWSAGHLDRKTLQTYGQEYYQHVRAFPRYLSTIHSQCEDIQTRQILLGNLNEEEQGDENHPELWQRFTDALGVPRTDHSYENWLPQTQKLVDGYFDLVRTDFATGLGALYAYEYQTPTVSKSKIDGLKQHYDIADERSLQFFNVHMTADEWHSEECANIIRGLSEDEQKRVMLGAQQGAKLLWEFLNGMALVVQ